MKLAGDRKLLLVIAVLVTGFLVAAMFFVPDDDLANADVSTYSARSGGAKATFELIQELGYKAERWESPLKDLHEDTAQGALLIVAVPRRMLSKENIDGIGAFVNNGGTALVTGLIMGDLIPSDRYSFEVPSQSWHKYPPGPPQALNRGIRNISMPEQYYWTLHAEDTPLFGDGKRAVAVTFNHGKGRVIWLASHIPLCNAGLKAEGNPEFLANVLRVVDPSKVYWFAEPSQTGIAHSAFTSAPVLAALTQVLFIFVLVLWTHSRRYGPVHALVENTAPIAQLEFVHTLGSLYGTANATNVAVEIAYRRFVFLASRHFALPLDDELKQRLSSSVARALYLPEKEVADLFDRCERAIHTPNLPRNVAGEYLNKLREYLVGLKLIQAETQEKH